MLHELINALEETLFMVFSAGLISWIIGLPLGLLLYGSGPQKLLENYFLHVLLKLFIGTTRSIPYVALSIALIPFTQLITGFNSGSLAAIIPLSLIGILHFSHYCNRAFAQIPTGLIEGTQVMGASRSQIIFKVLIPEAMPHCIQAFGVTLVHLIGYSTIAGVLGGGGLGHLLTYKGYGHLHIETILSVMGLLVLLVQVVQRLTQYIANTSNDSYSSY
jgi:D-methionine transport system permease protein